MSPARALSFKQDTVNEKFIDDPSQDKMGTIDQVNSPDNSKETPKKKAGGMFSNFGAKLGSAMKSA